jgi:hypothetical protein
LPDLDALVGIKSCIAIYSTLVFGIVEYLLIHHSLLLIMGYIGIYQRKSDLKRLLSDIPPLRI